MDISSLHHFIQKEEYLLTESKKLLILSKSYYRPAEEDCNSFINFVILGLMDHSDIIPRELTIFFNGSGYITSGEVWKGNEVTILSPEETEDLLSPFFEGGMEIKEPSL